jgi:ribosomal protein S18 acetylase RimI-like enzyme
MPHITLLSDPEGRQVARSGLFSLYEAALRPYIEATLGWDQSYQLQRFERSYPPGEIQLIMVDRVFAGYVAIRETRSALHVSLLLLLPEFRRRGIGQRVMKHVHMAAAASHRKVTLSSFKRNTGALRFYARRGYAIRDGDDVFADLVFDPGVARQAPEDEQRARESKA